jgi:hypothetical protein
MVKIVLTGYVAGLLCCSLATCIGGRQRVVLFLEIAGKIFWIVEANLIGNLGNGKLAFFQELGRMLQPDQPYYFQRGFACKCLDPFEKL